MMAVCNSFLREISEADSAKFNKSRVVGGGHAILLKNIFKVSYCIGNIDIILYGERFMLYIDDFVASVAGYSRGDKEEEGGSR